MYKYKITIFTPTYNRAYIIEKLYRSIKKQTFRNFEWLVVDDGSEDNTEEVINSFIRENNEFPIRYYKKENGGKSRTVNYALDLAEGELFFIMDSDDYLTKDALEKIVLWESTIKGLPGFCGVSGNKGISDKETPNKLFDMQYMDAFTLDRYKGNSFLWGEHAEVFYTEIFRRFKYPEYENEKFLTDCIAYDRMAAAGYKIRYFKDIIWIYEYLDDGITKHVEDVYCKNPYGYGLHIKERIKFCKEPLNKRIQIHYGFLCQMIQYGYTYKQIAKFLSVSKWYIWFLWQLFKIKNKEISKKFS